MRKSIIILFAALCAVGSKAEAEAQGYNYPPNPQPAFKLPAPDAGASTVAANQGQGANGAVYFQQQQGTRGQGGLQANAGNQFGSGQADSLTLLVPIPSSSAATGAQGTRVQGDYSGNAGASRQPVVQQNLVGGASQASRGQDQYGNSAQANAGQSFQQVSAVKQTQFQGQQQTVNSAGSAFTQQQQFSSFSNNLQSTSQAARGQEQYGGPAKTQAAQSFQAPTVTKTQQQSFNTAGSVGVAQPSFNNAAGSSQFGRGQEQYGNSAGAQVGGFKTTQQQSFNTVASAPKQPFPAFPGSSPSSSQPARTQNQYGNSASNQAGAAFTSTSSPKVVQQQFNTVPQVSSAQQFSTSNVASPSLAKDQGNYGAPGKAQVTQQVQSFSANVNSQAPAPAVSFGQSTVSSSQNGLGSNAGFSPVRGQQQQFASDAASVPQVSQQFASSGPSKVSSGSSAQGGYSYSGSYSSQSLKPPGVAPVVAETQTQLPSPASSGFAPQPLVPSAPAGPASYPSPSFSPAPFPAPSPVAPAPGGAPFAPLPSPIGSLPVSAVEAEEHGDYSAIPGEPDKDYPIFASVPETGFNCSRQQFPGYYADVSARCQVFHVCWDNRQWSFLCPNGTIFSQENFVCVWWNDFDCLQAPGLYNLNQNLYVAPQPSVQSPPLFQGPQTVGSPGLPLAASVAEGSQGSSPSQQYYPSSSQSAGSSFSGSGSQQGFGGSQPSASFPGLPVAASVAAASQSSSPSQQYYPSSSQSAGSSFSGSVVQQGFGGSQPSASFPGLPVAASVAAASQGSSTSQQYYPSGSQSAGSSSSGSISQQTLGVSPFPAAQQAPSTAPVVAEAPQNVITQQYRPSGAQSAGSSASGANFQQGFGVLPTSTSTQQQLPLAAAVAGGLQNAVSQQYLPPVTQSAGSAPAGPVSQQGLGSFQTAPAVAAVEAEAPLDVSQQYLPPTAQQGGLHSQGGNPSASLGITGGQQGPLQQVSVAATVLELAQPVSTQSSSGNYGGSTSSGGIQNNGQQFSVANNQPVQQQQVSAPSLPVLPVVASPVVTVPQTGYLPPHSGGVKY